MTGHWRWAAGSALAIAVAAVVCVSVVQAQTTVVVRAAISGQVLPLQLVAVGQAVHQGDPLLFVRTSTGGAVPAARATIDGQVVQVMVGAGDHVNIGDPVAAIQPQ